MPPDPTSPEESVPTEPEVLEIAPDVTGRGPVETVEHPAKVMRIASMIKQLLEEVRHAPLDEAGRSRLREIYKTSVEELAEGMSPDLQDELARVTLPFAEAETPSEPELRIAQAQLVGWLDGLFHGIQATVFAQQMAARAEIEQARRGLPPGAGVDGPIAGNRPPGYL
ncbi:MAG TPA: bacterial proteasome activator family protein [Acidimicrobiales bacterium]|nr:bacterial proteasome activator family protein [Acidimicrobiales bacterium]